MGLTAEIHNLNPLKCYNFKKNLLRVLPIDDKGDFIEKGSKSYIHTVYLLMESHVLNLVGFKCKRIRKSTKEPPEHTFITKSPLTKLLFKLTVKHFFIDLFLYTSSTSLDVQFFDNFTKSKGRVHKKRFHHEF